MRVNLTSHFSNPAISQSQFKFKLFTFQVISRITLSTSLQLNLIISLTTPRNESLPVHRRIFPGITRGNCSASSSPFATSVLFCRSRQIAYEKGKSRNSLRRRRYDDVEDHPTYATSAQPEK